MIKVWATTEEGEGYCELIGEYETLEDIRIRTSVFASGLVITLDEIFEEEEAVK